MTVLLYLSCTAQKMKFSIKDFFRKCDQIRKAVLTGKQGASTLSMAHCGVRCTTLSTKISVSHMT